MRSHADDLLAIVALESQRARAFIVGEDLGTVEEQVRAALAAQRVLSYRSALVREDGAVALSGAGARRGDDARPADHRRAVDRIRPGGAERLGLSPNEQGTREIARAGQPDD